MILKFSKTRLYYLSFLICLTACTSHKKEITLKSFNRIQIQGNTKVILNAAQKNSIILFGSSKSLKNTDIQIQEDKLLVKEKKAALPLDSIIINYNNIQEITATENIQLYTHQPIHSSFLILDLSNHCSASISVQTEYLISLLKDFAILRFSDGETYRHEIEIEDSAYVYAYPLNTAITQIIHNGYGKVEIYGQQLIDIKMNLKGQVDYKGYGKVNKTSKGGGIIFDANIYSE